MAAKNTSDSIQQQLTDSVETIDSSVVIQEHPQYMAGFSDSLPTDTAVPAMNKLPVIERPAVTAATPHGRGPLRDTGSMSLLLMGVFVVAVSYRKGYKYIENFIHNMFSTRRRENLFEDHTANETQILTALIANTCIVEGLLVYLGMEAWVPSMRAALQGAVFPYVLLYSALAVVFFLGQLLAYKVLGYVFSDKLGTKLWVDGFKASQSLLGLLLLPVVGLALVAKNLTNEMLICAIILYICARIVFICKGFRIFYSKVSSLVYFILYLCAAEIVPLFIMGASAAFLSQLLQKFLNTP